jgi:signal transduction histidine kinase
VAAQHELVQADKMAALGTLAGGIAHEFNNVIGGIRGCIDDALAHGGVETREPLEVALRATRRAADITEKLLQFARPRLEGTAECKLAELIAEVVDLVEPQARRQGVAVRTAVPHDLLVRVNSGDMHQVFLNLFTNALQAMPGGGQLTIAAARAGASVDVCVTDTGVGIPKAELAKVFDPFYSRKPAGALRSAGLGLSVSYGLVEAHGGTLAVSSEPGVGSTFTVSLPAPEVP